MCVSLRCEKTDKPVDILARNTVPVKVSSNRCLT
jgi:hypothetical protein